MAFSRCRTSSWDKLSTKWRKRENTCDVATSESAASVPNHSNICEPSVLTVLSHTSTQETGVHIDDLDLPFAHRWVSNGCCNRHWQQSRMKNSILLFLTELISFKRWISIWGTWLAIVVIHSYFKWICIQRNLCFGSSWIPKDESRCLKLISRYIYIFFFLMLQVSYSSYIR